MTIIARSGSFKTAMLQNLLKNYIDHSAWGAAFFSIEMPVASLAERYLEILDVCTGREVEKLFQILHSPTSRKQRKTASKTIWQVFTLFRHGYH